MSDTPETPPTTPNAPDASESPVLFNALGGDMKATFDNVFRESEGETEVEQPASRRQPAAQTGTPEEAGERPIHPATAMLLSQMPPLVSRALVYVVFAFIFIALTWAYFSETDVVVRGQAVVVPKESQAQHVHATVPGVVADLRVALGMHVKAGDVLMQLTARDLERLKAEFAQADLDLKLKTQALDRLDGERKPEVEQQIAKLDTRKRSLETIIGTARESLITLEVERTHRQAVLTADVAAKRRRLDLLRADHEVQLKRLDSRKAQMDASVTAANESLPILRAQANIAQSEYQAFQHAANQGMVPVERATAAQMGWLRAQTELNATLEQAQQLPLKIAELEVERQQLESQYAMSRADIDEQIRAVEAERDALQTGYALRKREFERAIAESVASVADVEMQQSQLRLAWQREREDLVREIDRARLTRDQARAHATLDEAASTIKAPISGEITRLSVTTPGTFVQPGQLLVTIARPDAERILLITVDNRDIAKLKDQPIKLKFDAYPFQQHGIVRGVLTSVSPDAIAEKEANYVYQLQARFDKVDSEHRVVTTRGKALVVKYGMTGSAEIVQEQRTILDIMLEPFYKLSENFTP